MGIEPGKPVVTSTAEECFEMVGAWMTECNKLILEMSIFLLGPFYRFESRTAARLDAALFDRPPPRLIFHLPLATHLPTSKLMGCGVDHAGRRRK